MADNHPIRQGKSWDLGSGPVQFTHHRGIGQSHAQLGRPDCEALPSPRARGAVFGEAASAKHDEWAVHRGRCELIIKVAGILALVVN